MYKKLLFCFFLIPQLAYSAQLDPDFSQPFKLSGDFLGLNLHSQNATYKGRFEATQGSMKIEGTEIKLQQKQNNQLDHIIAVGQPVYFQKRNYQTGELLKGQANKITYDANKLFVTLNGNAKISSDLGKSIQGETINYGLTSGEIEVTGHSKRRVQIIITPNSSKHSMPLKQ